MVVLMVMMVTVVKTAVMQMMVPIVIVVMVMMKATHTHWLPVQFQGERPNTHSHLQSLAQRCWHQFPFTNEQSKAVGGHLAQNRISSNSRARA